MEYLVIHYWPFLVAATVAGLLVGGWTEATRRPRRVRASRKRGSARP